MTNILYNDLKTLISASNLVPGEQYRITDYVTTISKADYTSGNHVFDVVVTAFDTNTLYDYAKALQHEDDAYFDGVNFALWSIKYNIDNIIPGYTNNWVDPLGKGCIYYMADEFANEAPFDFKNIKHNSKYLYLSPSGTDNSLHGQSYDNSIKDLIVDGEFIIPTAQYTGDCYNIEFGYNCDRLTVYNSHDVNLGDNNYDVTIGDSSVIQIGGDNNDVSIIGTTTGNIGSGNGRIEIDNGHIITIGNHNNNVDLGNNNSGTVIGDSNNDIIVGTDVTGIVIVDGNTDITIGNDNNDVTIEDSTTVVTGNDNTGVTVNNGGSVTIGEGNGKLTIDGGKTVVIGDNTHQIVIGGGTDIVVEDDVTDVDVNPDVVDITIGVGDTSGEGTTIIGQDGSGATTITNGDQTVVVDPITGDVTIVDPVELPKDILRYSPQTLTPEQQLQARTNIGASDLEDAPSDEFIYGRKGGDWEQIDDEIDPVFQAWLDANATYLAVLLDEQPINPENKYLNALRQWVEIAIGGAGYEAPLYYTNINSTTHIIGSATLFYKKISYQPEVGETPLTVQSKSNVRTLIGTYLYDAQISTTTIDSGNFGFKLKCKVNNTQGTNVIEYVSFLYHIDGTRTDLFTCVSDPITNTTFLDNFKQFPSDTIHCVETDRFGVDVYFKSSSNAFKTLDALIGDGHASYMVTPLRLRHDGLRDLDGNPNFLHVNEEQKALIISTAEIVSGHSENIEHLEENKANTVHTHTKSEVGLANVDNTSDLTKPISTATQTALNSKADKGTTLADYEIADAYTQTEIDTKLVNIKHNDILNRNDDTEFLHITETEKTNFITASDFVEDFISNAAAILYADLLALKNNGELIPGQKYRITDYTTTTSQADTSVAGNDFDIVVVALSESVLSENASVVQRDGTTYFDGQKLSSWQIKYNLDNDDSKFEWANTSIGKGVIYRMIDEFNNDIPYDFKNIKFLKNSVYVFTFGGTTDDSLTGFSIGNTIKELLLSSKLNLSFNTFGTNCSYNNLNFNNRNITFGDYCNFNTFGEGCTFITFGVDCYYNTFGNICGNNTFGDECNANTFGNSCRLINFTGYCDYNNFGDSCYSNNFGYECFSNTFGNQCYSNTFADGCFYNTFGNGCNNNTFGADSTNNNFDNGCRDNNFGDECFNNTFGANCRSNTFGSNCYYNMFGNYCYFNTFGDECQTNTFGNVCGENTFTEGEIYNTFGNECNNNTFGIYCSSNTFGNNCIHNNFYHGTTGTVIKNFIKYVVLEDGVKYNNFYSPLTTSGGAYLRRIRIKGLDNATPTPVQILLPDTSSNYEWVIAKNLSGIVEQYSPKDHTLDISNLQTNKANKSTTLNGYGITNAYTKVEIDNKISAVFRYKGNVATYTALTALTGMVTGDVYNVTNTGINYAWTGSAWESLAGTIDLSAYLEKTEAADTYETIENVSSLNDTVSEHTGYISNLQTNKQNKLIAGDNIVFSDNVISVDLDDYLKTTDAPSNNKTYGRKNGSWTQIVTSGGGGVSTISITWSDLKDLRDAGTLVPGQSYKIIDYECTTTTLDSRSVGNLFDIVVIALDESHLSENASATYHAGDTYFSSNNAKLETWKLKYCIDNDVDRFEWADAVTGKGVIYYMKDERNNECPYDFKNIQYLKNSVWLYTFGGEIDNSVVADSIWMYCINNIIGVYNEPASPILKYKLSFNTFGRHCRFNKFGDYCFSNTFDQNCQYNTFGNYCDSNTFGGAIHSNNFGDWCRSNTFGSFCSSNTFGDHCYYNVFGESFSFNTVGNECSFNNFYHGTTGTTPKQYIRFIGLEDGCQYNNFYSNVTTSYYNYLQRIRIKGLSGTSTTPLVTQITLGTVNTNYEWVICRRSNGVLKQYCPDD